MTSRSHCAICSRSAASRSPSIGRPTARRTVSSRGTSSAAAVSSTSRVDGGENGSFGGELAEERSNGRGDRAPVRNGIARGGAQERDVEGSALRLGEGAKSLIGHGLEQVRDRGETELGFRFCRPAEEDD